MRVIPCRKATWVPGTAEQPICIGDDCRAVCEQVARDETVPLPAGGQQPTSAGQIVSLYLCLAMSGSVVLVDSLSSVDSEIAPGDKASPLIEDLVLRGHRDLCGQV
ncbi:MAG TPA: hypothetical protein VNT27_00505 [Propionibacteriaceae bacterium]|nr:hypothetical protein [Propionibacteriaceae bacterium]